MKEYLILADVKTTVSMKVKANNQQEAEMIAQRQLNDLSVANIKLHIENLNGEVLKPNVENFEIQINNIEEE
ncbi:hypothetical protein [Geobacillus vulcani]|uniref:hypothetical protein n=1 Tax=Geobacillus vulcani TaxID=135517 RepID=UPI0004DEE1F8|nr:hypothetical protein [Geobacillus vulcani]